VGGRRAGPDAADCTADPRPPEVVRPMTPDEEARNRVPIAYRPGTEAPATNDGLLDPSRWNVQARASDATEKEGGDASPPQEAQARPQRNPQNIDRYFDDLDERVRKLAEKWGADPNFIHAIFSMESGWFNERARENNNPFGYTVQPNSDAHRAGQRPGDPTQISSLDRAFDLWSEKWGPRIRESKNMRDFLENLQRGGTGMYNEAQSVHNTDRPRVDREKKPIKSSEERAEEQYRTVLNRRRIWEQTR
jgi:hypothetical protein